MSGVNKVILVGHVKTSPELKRMKGGIPYVQFLVTTRENIHKGQSEVEHIESHNIVIWRDQAEMAARLLKPDVLVHIEGQVRTRHFMDGAIKRYVTEIIANYFDVL